MRRDLRKYLWDIRTALARIEQFTTGKTQQNYEQDQMMQMAVERGFITVGEVMSRIIHYFPETKARIADARKIANFRNIVVHEYDAIDKDTIWEIITKSVPVLKSEVQVWLDELDPQHP